jgi:hypothetical protein
MRVAEDKAPAYVGAAVAVWAVLMLVGYYLGNAINNQILASTFSYSVG